MLYDDSARREVSTVALDWYRGVDGNDQSIVNGMSTGSAIACILWQGMSAIRQYASQYSSLQSELRPIHLQVDASRLREFVASRFADVVLDLPETGELHLDEQFIKPSMLVVPRIASVIRTFQVPFSRLIRTRTNLYITDWSTALSSRRDPRGLVWYRKSIFKSAIPACTKKDEAHAESMFPLTLGELFTPDRLKTCLDRHGYRWSLEEQELILQYGNSIYEEVRPSLVKATTQFLNMLTFYRPKRVFLPGDTFESWIIMYQLCRNRSIETNMYMDGYMTCPLFPVIRDESGRGWLVDRVASYGAAQSSLIESVGFPADRIDIVQPPFLEHLLKNKKTKFEFDVIVMTWIPYTVNPQADYSSPISTLELALNAIQKAGLVKIAVKVKADAESTYVLRVARNMGLNVTILKGRFYKHVWKAPLVVGGISTALAETAAVAAKYFVFEPYENGYTDEMIEQSQIMSRETISRNEDELYNALLDGSGSWIGDIYQTLFVD